MARRSPRKLNGYGASEAAGGARSSLGRVGRSKELGVLLVNLMFVAILFCAKFSEFDFVFFCAVLSFADFATTLLELESLLIIFILSPG